MFSAMIEAVYHRLQAEIGAHVTGIYTKAPQSVHAEDDANFPYIVIKRPVSIPFDTDGTIGLNALVDVKLFHRDTTITGVDIPWLIRLALDRHNLSIAGAHTVDCTFNDKTVIPQGDGKTVQEITTFRIKCEAQ